MKDQDFACNGNTQIRDPGSHENDGRGFKQGWSNGLTKLELFSAMAMQGILAAHYSQESPAGIEEASGEQIAQVCVQHARELIKELSK